MNLLKTVIIDPIKVDELTSKDIEYGITDNACAVLQINNLFYDVPKCGTIIKLNDPIDYNNLNISAKLYIYDRQPKNGRYFTVFSEPLLLNNNSVHLYFHQNGPAICFSLLNRD